MSIPPLVCSTPPPPEQCEDDKDPDDFDINYNLSQEDENDEADYDYGNFSSFNHFQTPISEKCQEPNKTTTMNGENLKSDKDVECQQVQISGENNTVEPLEDDIIEDLDLKVDQEPAVKSAIDSRSSDHESEVSNENSVKDLQINIPLNNSITQDEVEITRLNIETITMKSNETSEMVVNEIDESKLDDIESKVCDEVDTQIVNQFNDGVVEENITDVAPQQFESNNKHEADANNGLDDFEDFDDYQCITSDIKPEIFIDSTENPWENKDSQDVSFGDFTANFESNEEPSLPPSSEEPVQNNDQDLEDDFGDFDEFQSVNEPTSNTTPSDRTPSEEVPVLNFQLSDSEHQIIERINEVIHAVYPQEIKESGDIFQTRIESSLGETWGYLLETDIRQPYIVNWNNSLAQKTLLKALCIDSRNILFGPKWGANMPKYAANLSAAPLQPQKQSGQSGGALSETAHPEKGISKTSWIDPFTSDGQQFTYAEALLLDLEHLMATLDQMAHNHSTLKISELLSHACSTENERVTLEAGPTDLDVFEATVSTKSDKIYSNTLSIQPMRQINLPDTHIFTPTDSETPRSKTIHYDNTTAPTVLIPKSENISPQTHSLENDNDYWEFQDFRGTTQSKDLSSSDKELKSNVNKDTGISKETIQKSNMHMETQVLQPVKLELIMPTLNWPNPGEVKETFDDFTDFVSNAPFNNETLEPVSQSVNSMTDIYIPNAPKSNENKHHMDKPSLNPDDDFEMFQSAVLPPSPIQPGFSNIDTKLVREEASVCHVPTNSLSDIDVVFGMVEKLKKSENISQSDIKSIETPNKNVGNVSTMNELIFNSQIIPPTTVPITNVLQPTIATPTGQAKASQQKLDQILQPLSLESYSQINWPNPGIDLQDLSRFNPVETLQSFKSESTGSQSKTASPAHSHKGFGNSQSTDDDVWGEFVSSKPRQQTLPKKPTTFSDDDEWTDFVSSPSVNPHNGLNTISLNVHTNSSLQKSSNSNKYQPKAKEIPLDIPSLNYITPKTTSQSFNERHFQNL